MTESPSIRDILEFWFLPLDHPDHGKQRDTWWAGPPEFDAEIRERFSASVEQAIAGGLDHWRQSPDGALALILLCDQFPRNIHRGSARAFEGDAKAMETAHVALARFYPAAFGLTLRAFFYMPFQHSESLSDQELGCALFAPFNNPDMMKYAIWHRDIIARFGRFPHRNAMLGRAPRPDEVAAGDVVPW
jgi:uncharacterized protein (DUF924 family)